MSKLVIYDSLTGNTKLLAESIYNYFKEKEEKIEIVNAKSVSSEELKEKINNANILFIGSWTDKGDCSEKIKEVYNMVNNKKIFVFATCGFGGDQSYYAKLFDRVKAHINESNEIIGNFYCQGKMPLSVKERYINLIKANPEDKNLEVSLENFEKALSHPNEDDLNNLKNKLKEVI